MGTASKVISVAFRSGELICSVMVTALLGRFFIHLHHGHGHTDNRLIYAQVISCLGIVISILLFPPLKYSFYAFPLDAILFICWIVAFGLLADLTGTHTCSAHWYWNYWGYYWGEIWHVGPRTTIRVFDVNSAGCWSWKCILAFTYMGAIAWLLSAFLGLYVFSELREGRESHKARALKEKILRKKQHSDPEDHQ